MDELAKINNLDIDNPNEQHSLVKGKLIRTFETEPNSQVNRIFIAHEYSFNKCQLFTCPLSVILQNDAP